MKYEDLSPGAFLLHKGVGKLLDYGTNVFEMFADEFGYPIEAILKANPWQEKCLDPEVIEAIKKLKSEE